MSRKKTALTIAGHDTAAQYSLTKYVFFSTYVQCANVGLTEDGMRRNRQRKTIIATAVISVVSGLLVCMALWSATHDPNPQFGVVVFLIGFFVPWLIHFALWFVRRGFRHTAFPVCSRMIVNRLHTFTAMELGSAQRKILIEATGAMVMVLCALVLAAAAFSIIAGLVYIAGHFRW